MAFSAPNEDIEKARYEAAGAVSVEADAEVLAGQVVTLSGDLSVSPSDTDGEQALGVATQSVSAGDMVTVMTNSARVLFTAGAAVTAGDQLASHGGTGDDGTGATADGTGDYNVGVALEGGSSGDRIVVLVAAGGQIN